MCTYVTERVAIEGSGKGAAGWFTLTLATAYVDHPVHAPYGHTVNIDFLAPERGPSARVAVELTEEAALALVGAITRALAAAPAGLASRAQSTAQGSGAPTGTSTSGR
jgi:uncharacterized protein DUF6295